MSDHGVVPIFEALSTTPKVMGCERRWFVLSAAVAALIGGPGGLFSESLPMFFAGLLLFSIALVCGRYWTEQDPAFRDVYVEAFRYESSYAASSRWDVKDRPPRSWT